MTEEQIKQNAEDYINENTQGVVIDANVRNFLLDVYLAGAHSRDEEIKELEQALAFAEDVVDAQKKELKQLRNPWISASKQLPPEDKEGSNLYIDCLVMAGDGNSFFYVIAWYDYSSKCWYEKYDFYQTHLDGNKVYYWMKLPKCNHIETEGGDK